MPFTFNYAAFLSDAFVDVVGTEPTVDSAVEYALASSPGTYTPDTDILLPTMEFSLSDTKNWTFQSFSFFVSKAGSVDIEMTNLYTGDIQSEVRSI